MKISFDFENLSSLEIENAVTELNTELKRREELAKTKLWELVIKAITEYCQVFGEITIEGHNPDINEFWDFSTPGIITEVDY